MLPKHSVRRGFTLVELLIVVVIIGVVATAVIGKITTSTDDSRQVSFVSQLHRFIDAEMLYRNATGEYLPDGSSGVCPAGFEEYIDPAAWERETVIGGVWDSALNDNGITSAIGVHFDNVTPRTDAFMRKIDETMDDGDLTTGTFQKFGSDRFYWIIAQ